jgi:uncharacterized phage protein (TIGR01671 family)
VREIKFRAFYKPLNIMVDAKKLESINFEVKTLGVYIPVENKGFHKFRTSDFELMQYTGLKDKNGKEIYEGDIVKNSGYHELCIVEYHHSQYIGRYRPQTPQYKHLEQNERDKDLSYIGLGFYVCERKAIEIIGNVYENADLLAEVTP